MRNSKSLKFGIVWIFFFFVLTGCNDIVSRKNNMKTTRHINLSDAEIQTNSSLWKIKRNNKEEVIQITGNLDEDNIHGKVALIGKTMNNYTMEAELKFLGNHLKREGAGWFGIVIRARDCENYELIWFMPAAESGRTVAYLPVAHGIVPWWTEAYANQQNFSPTIPHDNWFRVRVDVIGDVVTLWIEGDKIFSKKLTYYLSEGQPGLYIGTATDAAFRDISIKEI